MQSKQMKYSYGKTGLIGELFWDEQAGGKRSTTTRASMRASWWISATSRFAPT
jgi:hypothetical protein